MPIWEAQLRYCYKKERVGRERKRKMRKRSMCMQGWWWWSWERQRQTGTENENKRDYSWTNTYYCASITGAQKSSESEHFSISLKKMMSTNMLSDSPWTKNIRNSRLKHLRLCILLLHMSSNTMSVYYSEKTRKLRFQNMSNISQGNERSQKNMPETDCQETDVGCLWVSTSKSESNKK